MPLAGIWEASKDKGDHQISDFKMKLIIANGHLIDPIAPENTGMSIMIEDGRVTSWIKPGESFPEDAEIFDASGMLVSPGFIDMHVHLREPGQEIKRRSPPAVLQRWQASGPAFARCRIRIVTITRR